MRHWSDFKSWKIWATTGSADCASTAYGAGGSEEGRGGGWEQDVLKFLQASVSLDRTCIKALDGPNKSGHG